MKQFLFKMFIFLLLILSGAIVLEYLVKKIPNTYSYKDQYLKVHSKKIKLLFLGCSQTDCTIQPLMFPESSFCMANPAQGFEVDYHCLTHYQFDSLKTVVISVLPIFSCLRPVVQANSESFMETNFRIDFDLYERPMFSKYSYRFFDLYNSSNQIKTYYFKKKSIIMCDSLGNRSASCFIDNNVLSKKREIEAANNFVHQKSAANLVANVKFLKQIVAYCKLHHINLVFYSIPIQDYYRKILPQDDIKNSITIINSIVKNNENVFYYNRFYSSKEYSEKDYMGASHFYPVTGGVKFSNELLGYLKRNRIITMNVNQGLKIK